MKRLDRFILKNFLVAFFAILFVVVFIMMMQFLWVYIDELVGKGLGLKVILEFMGWGACTMLPVEIPLATLLASMMVIGQMAENVELTAIKASGVSLLRVMAPVFAASVVICVGAYFVSNNLVPVAFNKIYTLRDDFGRTKDEIKIPAGIFYDGIDGYVLRVDSRDDSKGMMYGVMVYDHSAHKGNVSLTMADSASLKMSKAKDYLTFTLYSGTNYQEDNILERRDTSLELNRTSFDRQELLITLENYAFEKSDSSRFGDQVKSKRNGLLIHERDSINLLAEEARAKHYHLMMTVDGIARPQQLDTTWEKKGLSNFQEDRFMVWDKADHELSSLQLAVGRAEALSTRLEEFGREVYDYLFFLPKMRLEIMRKFAAAFACLILFLIGAPLGSFVRRGSLGVSAIISVLFFVLYWVIDISGQKIARDGGMNAALGAFIASLVLMPIAAFLVWKAVHDSSMFNFDQFKMTWRKTKTKIMSVFKKPRIVYMGTPDFAVAPLDALIQKGYDIVGIVTVADKPSGRGLKMNESAVKKYAVEHNIPVLQPVKLKDPEFLEALAAWKADLFVVVAFRMLPEEVWRMPRLGTFNLHAALLPQYRGAAPINWAVINGERITGATTFMIDKNIDTGGIILRQDYRIKDSDNAGDVHDALMEIGQRLVCDTVEGLIEGNVETRVQRSFIQGSEELRPAPKLTRELCNLDWNDSSVNVRNLVRGLSPYPTAYTEIENAAGERLSMKIFRAEFAEDGQYDSAAAPGTIMTDGKTWLTVRTADGALRLEDIQLSGKKRMEIGAFLLGFREPQSWKAVCGTSRAVKEAIGTSNA